MCLSSTERSTIKSRRGCPGCGGRYWLPLGQDGNPLLLLMISHALIDLGPDAMNARIVDGLDMCLKCGIVVTG